jgi:hypothetical protein
MLKNGYLGINTTLAIDGVDFAWYFLEQIEQLFGTSDFSIVWTEARTDKRGAKRRARCDEDLLTRLQASGGFAVEGGERGSDWSGGLSWRRYPRSVAMTEGVPSRFTPNQVTMSLPETLLRQDAFLVRLRYVFRALCAKAEADYGVVRPWVQANTRFIRSPLGHAAGLEGIYWLNYFGPAYVRLIGLDSLLKAPAASAEQIGPQSCLVRLTDGFFDPESSTKSAHVRQHLGNAYFLKGPQGEDAKSNISSGSLLNPTRMFGFISSLAKDRRIAEAELATAADRRPSFDIDRMYEPA